MPNDALVTVDADASVDSILEILERDGAAVIKGLCDAATMDKVARELSPWLDLPVSESPLGNNRFSGFQTLRTSALIAKSETCREIVLQPTIDAIMQRVLGPQCSIHQLTWTQAIKIGPGESAQVPHRDTMMYPFKRPGPECFVNTIWALTDFTADNGATRVYVGSHQWDDQRVPTDKDRPAVAEMSRGSVIVYYGSTYHGGGANVTTDTVRIGVGFAYTLGWLRQEENQYLACPIEVARGFSPRLQQLLGYAEHFPFLGWYEGQDSSLTRGAHLRRQYGTKLQGRSDEA